MNDIGSTFSLEGDRDTFSGVLIDAYFALVQKLYDAGGRNFLFAMIPHVDQSPLVSTFLWNYLWDDLRDSIIKDVSPT